MNDDGSPHLPSPEVCSFPSDLMAIGSNLMGLQPLLEDVFDFLARLPGGHIVRRGAILLRNTHGELVQVAQCGFSELRAAYCERVTLERCGCGHVTNTGQMACRPCEGDLELKEAANAADANHFILPLSHGGHVLGIVTIFVEPSHIPSEAEHALMHNLSLVLSSVVELVLENRTG